MQVSTSSEALSGVYAVLGRRRSRILREEMREGSDLFIGAWVHWAGGWAGLGWAGPGWAWLAGSGAQVEGGRGSACPNSWGWYAVESSVLGTAGLNSSSTPTNPSAPSPPLPLPAVHAYLPAEASFGFADELRRRSSGAAAASLMLSHWERLQVRGGATCSRGEGPPLHRARLGHEVAMGPGGRPAFTWRQPHAPSFLALQPPTASCLGSP